MIPENRPPHLAWTRWASGPRTAVGADPFFGARERENRSTAALKPPWGERGSLPSRPVFRHPCPPVVGTRADPRCRFCPVWIFWPTATRARNRSPASVPPTGQSPHPASRHRRKRGLAAHRAPSLLTVLNRQRYGTCQYWSAQTAKRPGMTRPSCNSLGGGTSHRRRTSQFAASVWLLHLQRLCCRYGRRRRSQSGQWRRSGS
jgi:hypothetical protein